MGVHLCCRNMTEIMKDVYRSGLSEMLTKEQLPSLRGASTNSLNQEVVAALDRVIAEVHQR